MNETAVYVLQYEPPLRDATRRWLAARPFALVKPIHRASTWPHAMNCAVTHFLERTDLPRILILHGNVDPSPACDELWELDAPAVSARHEGHAPPHCRNSLQCGFLLIRREVLEAMEPPWFAMEFDWRSQTLRGCTLDHLRRYQVLFVG